jgi:hypothetical protein
MYDSGDVYRIEFGEKWSITVVYIPQDFSIYATHNYSIGHFFETVNLLDLFNSSAFLM